MRRVGIIMCGAGLALCVLAWAVSLANVVWHRPGVLVFGLCRGMLVLDNSGLYAGPGWSYGYGPMGRLEWWPYNGRIWEYYPGTPQYPGSNWALRLPIWMPSAAFAVGLAGAWSPWDVRARRRRLGLCGRCAYDVRGIQTCPECGTHQTVACAAGR